jgi:alpha-amylase
MVGFRNATRGQAVTDWWDNGGDAIAFGRGGKGFVAINHEPGSLTRIYQTSLPAGTYCDVQNNRTVTVDSSGRLTATLGSNTALAIYAGKSNC